MADGTQVFDYTFPAGPMGIALLESPQGMHIISIQPGSMADALGVYLGGTIVAVGDHDVRHMSRQEMMTTIHMQPRPITIRVSTTAETRLDPNAAAEALANLSITKKSPDERLLAAAAKGDPQLILAAFGAGATDSDGAIKAALSNRHAGAVYMLLQRGALARTIGVTPSMLHRPGLPQEQRVAGAALLLDYVFKNFNHAVYLMALRDTFTAGACLRCGPLILAMLHREGHYRYLKTPVKNTVTSPCLSPSGWKDLLEHSIKLNDKAKQISWSTSGAQDAVVCGLVRTPVRRRYRGYDLAGIQLRLCLQGLHSSVPPDLLANTKTVLNTEKKPMEFEKWSLDPWSPSSHATHYAHWRPFKLMVHTLLLCHNREGCEFARLPDVLLHMIIERLAYLTFWAEPLVNLDEGADVLFRGKDNRFVEHKTGPPAKGAMKWVDRLNNFVEKTVVGRSIPHQASYNAADVERGAGMVLHGGPGEHPSVAIVGEWTTEDARI